MNGSHYIAILILCLQSFLVIACFGGDQDLVKQLDGLVITVESRAGTMSETQLQQFVGRYNGLVSSINRQYSDYSPSQLEKAEKLSLRFKNIIGRRCPDAVLIVLKPSGGIALSDMEREVAGRSLEASSPTVEPEHQISSGHDAAQPTKSPELNGDEIFEEYASAVFIVTLTDGTIQKQGSGFFISPDGLAVSNYHVFQGGKVGSESISLYDGNVCKIKEVVAKGHCDGDGLRTDDFILFRVDIGDRVVKYIPLSRERARVGQKVYAIGSPRGFENTFSSGEISQIRNLDEGFLYQISVPIDHGSSGGVLLNGYGEAIGITSGGFDDSGANLNFAVDIHVIDNYIN